MRASRLEVGLRPGARWSRPGRENRDAGRADGRCWRAQKLRRSRYAFEPVLGRMKGWRRNFVKWSVVPGWLLGSSPR
jgi:hypothetical protein